MRKRILGVLMAVAAIFSVGVVNVSDVSADSVDRQSTEFTNEVKDIDAFDKCANGTFRLSAGRCAQYRNFCYNHYSSNYDDCKTYSDRYNEHGRARTNDPDDPAYDPDKTTNQNNNNNDNSSDNSTTTGNQTESQPYNGECGEDEVKTNLFGGCVSGNNGEGIYKILATVLTVLTYGVGIAATIGFVIAGLQYLTARDDAGQVAKAKMRMLQIVIGIVVYAMIWAILSWLLPGGIGN